MVLSSLSLTHLLLILLLIPTDLTTSSNENNYYLKLPLLHKNLSSSPSKTLFTDSTRLSTLFSTLNPQKTLKSPLVSGAPSGSGQYFVDFSIGTPPQKLLLVADTGSDLVWVKCSACRNCSSHLPGSAFLVRHSSTFSPFHCYDKACLNFPHSPQIPKIGRVCNRTRLHSTCRYEYTYGDESKTSGFFSREVTRLNTSSGKEAKLSNLAFGCGFQVSGPSITGASFNGANGVMGLGRGSISFSTQLGQRFGNKFSYCLMDYTLSPPPTSFLMIGKAHESEPVSKPIISRSNGSKPNLSFTPFQNNPTTNSTFYYVGIKSVIINGVRLRIDPSVWLFDEEGNGGTVIDSGTTLSFFAEPAYRHILTAVKRRVRYPVIDDPDQVFELCVNVSGSVNPRLPRLSFKLVGNSVFSPPSANYFIDTADGVKCLAIQAVTSQTGFSVIGNLMQQGFLFEFDREKSRLGFTRHGCSIP